MSNEEQLPLEGLEGEDPIKSVPQQSASQRLTELSQYPMPFGGQKGEPLDNVDLKTLLYYVEWDQLRDPFKAVLEEYLAHPTIQRELVKRELI